MEKNSEVIEDLEGLESATGCCCHSQCSSKLKVSGNGKVSRCPCKARRVLCSNTCTCCTMTKPCKNKAQPPLDGRGPNTKLLPSQEISVEDMIDALDHETLVKVAKQGFCSRGLQLKDLIAQVQSESDELPRAELHNVPSFCVCVIIVGKCPLTKNKFVARRDKNVEVNLGYLETSAWTQITYLLL